MSTTLITILVSIPTAALTMLVIEFGIRPVVDQRTLRREIAAVLVMYADVYWNPGYGAPEQMAKAHLALRELASRLAASDVLIVGYRGWARLRLVVPRPALDEAGAKLIGISNGVSRKDRDSAEWNGRAAIEIKRLLGLARRQEVANAAGQTSPPPEQGSP